MDDERKTCFLIILLLIIYLVAGCNDNTTSPKGVDYQIVPEANTRIEHLDQCKLPTGAKNIVDLGNGWLTFELIIDGKNRKFMYARYYTYNKNFVGTITELKNE